MKHLLRVGLVWATLVASATASSPAIRGMKPAGGQRGTEVEVTITGQRLADARELTFYKPGIEMTKLQAANEGSVVATLKIAARRAARPARLPAPDGDRLSASCGRFSVGSSKDVAEVEPNNDFAKPQPIAMNVTVNGVADNEDVDYFAVEAKKGERITAEVEGIRLGITLFDPYVAIIDAKRFELASSDDAALVWQDGFASVVAPEDGKYIIQVRESAYARQRRCLYRLHVGNFPRPTATVPAGGKLGETVDGAAGSATSLGETTTKVTLPADRRARLRPRRPGRRGDRPYPNVFRLIAVRQRRSRPSRTTTTAHGHAVHPPVALNGVIGKPGDVDHLRLRGQEGQDLRRPRLRPPAPLAARLGPVTPAKKGAAHRGATTTAAAPTATSGSRAPRTPSTSSAIHGPAEQGRARLRLPDRGQPGRAEADA